MVSKVVSFGDEEGTDVLKRIVEIQHISDYTDEEIENSWYGYEDFAKIKLTARLVARHARKEGGNHFIDQSFSFRKNRSTGSDPLIKWSRYAHIRRGLEQWISQAHFHERREKKSKATIAVLRAQQVLKSVGVDAEAMSLQLAKLSSAHSDDARKFAQRMGQADAACALAESYVSGTTHGLSKEYIRTAVRRHIALTTGKYSPHDVSTLRPSISSAPRNIASPSAA